MRDFKRQKISLPAVLLAICLWGLSSVAAAQETGTYISEGDFASFVVINLELQELADEYQQPFTDAGDDPAKRAELEQEVQEKTKSILAKNNLTPERYREIYRTVNADPQLRDKALQMIEQERQKR
jgi:hypothetical protein